MCGSRSFWQGLRARLLGGLALPGLVAVATHAWADPPALQTPSTVSAIAQPPQPAVPTTPRVLDLAACRALALEKQPAVAAAHASLAAAIAREHALNNLCLPALVQRDLPLRRQQAALGVTAAQASVLRAEIDTIYAVQFSFVSYLYAIDQSRLARDVLSQLKKLRAGFENPKEDRDKRLALARVDALTLLADGRQQEALVGKERALSALREAIGLSGDCPLALAEKPLNYGGAVNEHQVVELALARRPEVILASIGTEVTDLEVCAQRSRLFALSVWTFAAGSDIHANPLPSASFNHPGYRAGAIGLEMPIKMVGKRDDRVEAAKIYNSRAHSVLEKTRNLLRLECEQAFYRWKEANARVDKFLRGWKLLEETFRNLTDPPDARRLTDFLDTARLVTELRFELNRARYEVQVALIALERATAEGFSAGLDKESAP
jgi:outer membrane protein TolC